MLHCLYYISSIDKILNTNINAYLPNKYNKRFNTLFVKTIEIVTMFNKFWHLQYNSPNSHLSWKYKIMVRKSVVLVLMHQFLRCVIVWTLACWKKCFILQCKPDWEILAISTLLDYFSSNLFRPFLLLFCILLWNMGNTCQIHIRLKITSISKAICNINHLRSIVLIQVYTHVLT